MLYVLAFAGCAAFGVVMMCCFKVSGQGSREEEYTNGGQNQSDGI